MILVLAGSCVAEPGQAQQAENESAGRVRRIVLRSRHLGAHGLGYNQQSMEVLSKKLGPCDIPILIALLADQQVRVGAQFALASECEAAIFPIRDAAQNHKMSFLDAEDTMGLMEDFGRCSPEARQRATAMRSQIHTLEEVAQRNLEQQAEARAEEDARIQKNGLKMTDPKQALELNRQEREEVYRRSLQAMGLKEDGPMTPAQRDLVDRMYRTMVLGESANKPQN